jgi:hypothetical protein
MEDTKCLVITVQDQYELFEKAPKLERFFRMLLQLSQGTEGLGQCSLLPLFTPYA